MLRRWMIGLVLLVFVFVPAVAQDYSAGLIGRYEISYMYNSMHGGGPSGLHNPVGTLDYCGVQTAPVAAAGLQPGFYTATVVSGRESSNPGCPAYGWVTTLWESLIRAHNPTAVFPETGFDGGTTDPGTNPAAWTDGVKIWVGPDRYTGRAYEAAKSVQALFEVKAGESVWLYIPDWYIADNLGGTTVVLRRVLEVKRQIVLWPDDVNEDGTSYSALDKQVWVGTGRNIRQSYTGLRFHNLAIPNHAEIISAAVAVYAPAYSWIGTDFLMAAEARANSTMFTAFNRPSQRLLTVSKVEHHSNVAWQAGNWYTLGDMKSVVQEVVNLPGWNTSSSLNVILKGIGSMWGRKYISAFDSDPRHAPRLTITYVLPIDS